MIIRTPPPQPESTEIPAIIARHFPAHELGLAPYVVESIGAIIEGSE